MRVDAVLTTETNPMMSGIAKFNQQLAQRLGVPLVTAWGEVRGRGVPLLSVRATPATFARYERPQPYGPFDLFLHGEIGAYPALVASARRVFAANAALAAKIRLVRSDVISAWCPSLIEHVGAFPVSDITLFQFGMGHKLTHLARYARLKALLDATGQTYTLYLSSGLHTGTAGDQGYVDLERVFGDHVIFLGILSDRAVAHYLATSTYVVAFFEQGLRENNTSVLSALEAGATVITNCDAQTPPSLATGTGRVIDLSHAEALFPHTAMGVDGDPRCSALTSVVTHRTARHDALPLPYTWDALVPLIQTAR
jgi:hypothetical protein